jgi:hypothetical protein
MGKELGGSLKSYIDQTRDALVSVSPDTAHRATLAFVQFAQGDYAKVAKISATVAEQDTGKAHSKSVSRAFAIVKEHAALLDSALPRPATYEIFDPEDSDLLAKQVPDGQDPDHEFYVALDNALLLLYSAAWTASEQDRPHLLARQVFAQKLMDSR